MTLPFSFKRVLAVVERTEVNQRASLENRRHLADEGKSKWPAEDFARWQAYIAELEFAARALRWCVKKWEDPTA